VQFKPPVDALEGVGCHITYGDLLKRGSHASTRAMIDEPKRLDLRYKQLRVLAELW